MSNNRKRRKKYNVKNIFAVFLVIFTIIMVFYAVLNKGQNDIVDDKNDDNKILNNQTTYVNKITKGENFNEEIDKKLQDKIIEYMNTYFRAMSNLEEIDMTNLFSGNSYEEAYLHQTALSMLIDIRKLEKNDMRINDAKYDIIYTNLETDEEKITVSFLENNYLHFNFMKDIESKAYGIENTIVFNKDYEILSVRKVQDFYVMITNKYEAGKTNEDAKKELDTIKNNHISDYKNQMDNIDILKKEYKNNDNKPEKECDNKYDRTSALSYAKKYALKRNEDWMDYSDIGGNCQNYASQVLYSGGIPMDTVGTSDLQWKHYDSNVDSSNNKTGRSTSWTTVPYFYNYAKNNTGYGLCSIVDINPFYAEYGDIGQVGYDGIYRHTVVIIGNVKDDNGNILDLLLNSNSVNLENYPLSGYVYPYKRIIKILGWNEE